MGYTLEPETPAPDEQKPAAGYQLQPEQPNLSWGQAGKEALTNLPSSLAKNIGETVSGIGQLFTKDGLLNLAKLSLTTPTTLMPGIDPAQLIDKLAAHLPEKEAAQLRDQMKQFKAPMEAVKQDYQQAYGDFDSEKIKQTLAKDPARIVSDIATIASGGEAGLAKAPGLAGKIGRGAGMVAKADPTNIVTLPITKGGDIAREIVGGTTGVGGDTMREAMKAGFMGGEQADAFKAAIKGEVPARDIVGAANDALDTMKQNMYADYRTNKAKWESTATPADWTKINQAEHDMIDSTMTKGGVAWKIADADVSKINKLSEIVSEWRNNPNLHNLEDIDNLKQRLRSEIDWSSATPALKQRAQKLIKSVSETATDMAPPEYREAMKNYAKSANEIDEVASAFSLGDKASVQTQMRKLQQALRNNVNTQFGYSKEAAAKLADEGGAKTLLSTLAGHQANSWMPRGIHMGNLAASLPTGVATALGAGVSGAALGAGATLPFLSPRLMANTAHGLGAVGRPFGRAFRALPESVQGAVSTGMRNAFGPPGYGAARVLGRDEEEPHRRGGRVGYDDGGPVLDDDAPPPVIRASLASAMPKVIDPVASILSRKIGPSVMARGATAPMAVAPRVSAEADNSIGNALSAGAKTWNDEVKRRDDAAEKEKLRQQMLDAARAKADAAATGVGAPRSPAESVMPAGAAPVANPLKGDSYEDKVGMTESGGKDDAVNATTGTAGRFQFMPSTAEGIRKAHPELGISDSWRTSATDQKKLMKAYTDTSRDILKKQLGRDPTGGELYMLHFLGHAGGPRVLSQLSKPISDITTTAERSANPILARFGTGQGMLDYYNKLFG